MSVEAKAALREKVLRRRDALSDQERASLSRRVIGTVLDLPAYGSSDVVLAYASFGTELQTDKFLRCVLDDGKTLALPRVEGGGLVLYETSILARDLVPGTWGIREPNPERCSPADPDRVDFALIPGVAFDQNGRRLGYGGGFYDRLIGGELPGRALLVSGAFGTQMVDGVPVDPHDAPVDVVVTEKGSHRSG